MTLFFRVLEPPVEEKQQELLDGIKEIRGDRAMDGSTDAATFDRPPQSFGSIPGSPFAYWISDRIYRLFSDHPPLEQGDRVARAGGQTSNDDRYLRAWWEIDAVRTKAEWRTYVKGGAPSAFYLDQPLVASWDDTRLTFPGFVGRPGRANERPSNYELYFRPGLTWPLRASRFAPQAMPADSIFTVRGYAIIEPIEELQVTLALTSSRAFDFLAKLLLGRFGYPEFVVGVIQKIPLPTLLPKERTELSVLARRAWSLKRSVDTGNEATRAYVIPFSAGGSSERHVSVETEVASIQRTIDEIAYRLYAVSAEDRAAIESSSNAASLAAGEQEEAGNSQTDVEGDDDVEEQLAVGASSALTAWLIGIAFGRFDERLATGERALPPEPEPFDPLPFRSPGMYPEGEEPADRADILVDDEGHTKDLTGHVQRWAEHVGSEVPADLRHWLAREFFALHIKMYSKSRRKAPIYWQLATPSASYSVWLYIHAFSKDTLFRVQHDYVAPKLAHEERQLETLRAEAGPDPVTAQRKAIEAQEAFVEELRAFLDEVKRVAPLWNPDLDDGVIINFAPLWRLVPQLKPWQKELKSTWDALSAGKYDWAHLAMRLWPERVVPKCADDRSLAIAHGLEDVFWYQDDDEKWKPRDEPTKAIDALVKERTSAAVKAALKSLLEAPEAASGTRRGRRGRG